RQAIVARAATLPATKKRPYLPKRIAPRLQTSCHAYPAFRARPIRPATRVAGPSALRNVQIRHRSRGDLRGERDRLGQRRVRMDREADILRVAPHLDRERGLCDQVAGIRADDAGADHAMRLALEEEHRHPVRPYDRPPP